MPVCSVENSSARLNPAVLSLLCVFAGFAIKTSAATTAPLDKEFSLARWSADPLWVCSYLRDPKRPFIQTIYPEVPAEGSGAEGQNLTYEAGKSKKWFVEEQRGGGDLVEAGVTLDDDTLIKLGIRVLQWGFDKQNEEGGWDCPDTYHSASFFIEAAARAARRLRGSGLTQYKSTVDAWIPRFDKACTWMNQPKILNSDPYFHRYTHRSYLAAAAFGQVAALTGEKKFAETARRLASEAIPVQLSNGINPEKEGFDVGYQIAGMNLAMRYYTACDDPALRSDLLNMVRRGVDFELTKMDSQGTITTEGSTRLGHEFNREGKPKVIGYKPIFQALVGTAIFTGDSKYHDAAVLIARAQGWIPPVR